MLLKNIVELSVQGENIERFLNMCSHHNIKLYHITQIEDKCYFKIHATDFFLIKDIVKKSQVSIKISQKKGLYFRLQKKVKRKIFFLASCLCLLLLWVGSHFLWGIRIEGNHYITNDLIIEFLQEQGIYYGMPLSKIPIYELKTNLRNSYEEITWVSLYLEGTNLRISLKENDTIPPNTSSQTTKMDLIADHDGIIDSIVVRQGTGVVKAGEEVKSGDTLISGKVEISADDGTIKETKYCKADGDVYLIYEYPILENQSFEYLTKEYTGKVTEKFDLYLNQRLLKIPHFKIPYIKYDYLTENLEHPLIDLLSLPLKIKKNTYREYYLIRKKYTNSEAEKLLKEKLDKIIISLEEKGVQIIAKNVKIRTNDVYLSMTGTLTLRTLCNEFQILEEFK